MFKVFFLVIKLCCCPQLNLIALRIKLNCLVFGLLLTLLSCKPNTNTSFRPESELEFNGEYLKSLDSYQEIILIQTDDRLGEWGGNTFIVKIYIERDAETIVADYKELEGTREPPLPPSPNESSDSIDNWFGHKSIITEINKIKLTENDKKLIEDAIIELIKHKIRNTDSFGHSGISNRIMYKDSSLIVEDYPSIKWSNFQKLKKSLLEK